MNAITIYVLQDLVDFGKIGEFLVGGMARHAGLLAPLTLVSAAFMARWLVLWLMYRHRMFFKA
jgi:hypothetical protein